MYLHTLVNHVIVCYACTHNTLTTASIPQEQTYRVYTMYGGCSGCSMHLNFFGQCCLCTHDPVATEVLYTHKHVKLHCVWEAAYLGGENKG